MQCKNQLLSSLVSSNWLAYRYRINSLCIKFNHWCPVACLQKAVGTVGIAVKQGAFSHVRNASKRCLRVSAHGISLRTADFHYGF